MVYKYLRMLLVLLLFIHRVLEKKQRDMITFISKYFLISLMTMSSTLTSSFSYLFVFVENRFVLYELLHNFFFYLVYLTKI